MMASKPDATSAPSAPSALISPGPMPAASQNLGPAKSRIDQALTPEFLGHDIVKVYVGAEQKKFTIHKNVLCGGSDFFLKAFNGKLSTSQKTKLYLPEDDPDAFAHLVDYLYRGALPIQAPLHPDDRCNQGYMYASLYVIAEKYCLENLMNKLMDALYELVRTREPPRLFASDVGHIYHHTEESSKLRQYCAAGVAMSMRETRRPDADWPQRLMDILGDETQLFTDVFRLQLKYHEQLENSKGLKQFWDSFDICDFHVHSDGTRCSPVAADHANGSSST